MKVTVNVGAPSRTELGCAGHLIVASRCRWHRHTQVGLFRISSIGNYYPDRNGERETIGAGERAYFETMVFKTTGEPVKGNEGCGCFEIADWSEIDGECYATAGEAQAGHERYVAKYLSDEHERCGSVNERSVSEPAKGNS